MRQLAVCGICWSLASRCKCDMKEQIENLRHRRLVVTRSRRLGLSPALGKLEDSAYPGLVLFVVFVALVCGGGTRHGLWSDALVQIVSLPLLAVASFRFWALPDPS